MSLLLWLSCANRPIAEEIVTWIGKLSLTAESQIHRNLYPLPHFRRACYFASRTGLLCQVEPGRTHAQRKSQRNRKKRMFKTDIIRVCWLCPFWIFFQNIYTGFRVPWKWTQLKLVLELGRVCLKNNWALVFCKETWSDRIKYQDSSR